MPGKRTAAVIAADAIPVVDDFPPMVPLTPGELGVIETYLAALIDDVVRPGRSAEVPKPLQNPAPSGPLERD